METHVPFHQEIHSSILDTAYSLKSWSQSQLKWDSQIILQLTVDKVYSL